MKRADGFSVIEITIALGILGFIGTVMMIFANQMSQSVARANIDADADRLINNIQHLLNMSGDPKDATPTNPACDSALKNGGGFVTWDPIGTPGAHGVITSIVQNGAVIASAGGTVSPSLQINQMYLREPDPTPAPGGAVGEGVPVRSTTTRGGTVYNTVVAKLVVEFTVPGTANVAGGRSIARRIADVNVAIDPTDKHVAFCFNNQAIMQSHVDCATSGASPGHDCPNPLPDPACTKLIRPTIFDGSGNPICVCIMVCPSVHPAYTWQRQNNLPQGAGVKCNDGTVDPSPKFLNRACDPLTGPQTCVDVSSSGGCGPSANPPLPANKCYGFACLVAP